MAKTRNNDNVIDLAAELSRPVVSAPAAPVLDDEPLISEAVIDPEPEPEPQPVETYTETADSYENSEPKSLSPDDLAVIGVNLLDGLQRFAFAWARKKYVFTDEELELLHDIDPADNVIYQPGTKEAILKDKFKKHLKVVANLPFRDDEKQRLTDATKIYVRTTEIKVSPLTGLLLAYSEVIGLRAVNVFTE